MLKAHTGAEAEREERQSFRVRDVRQELKWSSRVFGCSVAWIGDEEAFVNDDLLVLCCLCHDMVARARYAYFHALGVGALRFEALY